MGTRREGVRGYCQVLGPPVRDVTTVVAGVLAQKAAGKQATESARALAVTIQLGDADAVRVTFLQ